MVCMPFISTRRCKIRQLVLFYYTGIRHWVHTATVWDIGIKIWICSTRLTWWKVPLGCDIIETNHAALLRCFFTPSDVKSASYRTLETNIQPPEIERKDLVRSASDILLDVWLFVSQRQNKFDRPWMSNSSTNQVVFHGVPNNARSFPVSQ